MSKNQLIDKNRSLHKITIQNNGTIFNKFLWIQILSFKMKTKIVNKNQTKYFILFHFQVGSNQTN